MRKKQRAVISSNDLLKINSLLKQLSDKPRRLDINDVLRILSQGEFYWAVIRNKNKKIVAMATMRVVEFPTNKKALIEDVVVDKRFRGRGLAGALMKSLLRAAKANGVKYVELTSNPDRIAANIMYQKLGFKKRDTNSYRFEML